MMRDDRYFDNALEFDAFRSVNSPVTDMKAEAQPKKLVDATDKWLVWGSGKILWWVFTLPSDRTFESLSKNAEFLLRSPGRFYATLVLKLILVHILSNYDCKMQEIKGPRSRQWRSAIIPKESIMLWIRPRTHRSVT